MNRIYGLAVVTAAMLLTTSLANAAVFVKYEGVPGDVAGPDGSGDWFVADSFSFGVEREMKESGEKGGTEDLNIGIGELQECTISKSIDRVSPMLAELALSGRSVGNVEVCVADVDGGDRQPVCYLRYKLERAFVKSWSTSGDADDRPTEEVAFYYNKIVFTYTEIPDGEVVWERKKRKKRR